MLPFDNLSPDPEQGYFADGLAEAALWEIPLNAWAGEREPANVRASAAEGWVRL